MPTFWLSFGVVLLGVKGEASCRGRCVIALLLPGQEHREGRLLMCALGGLLCCETLEESCALDALPSGAL